jgi:hypothetical protein
VVAVILGVITLIAVLVPELTKVSTSTSVTTSKISRVYEILCIVQTFAFTKSIILSVNNDFSVLIETAYVYRVLQNNFGDFGCNREDYGIFQCSLVVGET